MSKFSALAGLSGRRPNEIVTSRLPLEEIKERAFGDTRLLNEAHVTELAESIAALGLIEPLVIDTKQRLLAGGHRKAAIVLIHQSQPETFSEKFSDGIPVYQMDFDSEAEPERALAIETTENEKRRDYTPAEIREIAEKLRSAGYEDVKGRPKQGQRPLMPALSVVVGKSRRHLRRQLSETENKSKGESGTRVPLSEKSDPFVQQCQAVANQLQNLKPEKLSGDKKKQIEKLLETLRRKIETE